MEEYVNAFHRVHPEWLKIMKPYKHLLYKILKEIETVNITPPLEDVFNAFIFNPTHTKVVILGQDPYPKAGDACGLAFSAGEPRPKSLKNIYKCLNRLGYITESSDLTSWVLQGVFLLNTALTTKVGESNAHASIWHPLIKHIITDLCKVAANPIHFLLWGNHAQSFEGCISQPHIVKKWTHPSPLSGHDFTTCDNFDSIKHIDWSVPEYINIYTDGASILQKRASFAVYVPNVIKLYGLVDDKKFGIIDGNIMTDDDTVIEPTSQRGEYLAMCYALWLIKYLKIRKARVITDSANTKGIITEWTDKKTEKYKNPDLVSIMRELYNENTTTIEHVCSHGKEKDTNKDIYKKGNDVVDKLARKTVETLDKDYTLNVIYAHVDLGIR